MHRLYATVRAAAEPRAAHALWRAGRDDLFATHPASPLLPADRRRFRGLQYWDYDESYRFQVEIDGGVSARRLELTTATDGVVPFERLGVIHLPALGDLDVWWLASYGGGVFLPIKDALAGRKTYGGGRYVLDTVKGADLGSPDLSRDAGRGASPDRWPTPVRTLIVDLNFAYNPSCAYDPAWVCPLPQAGNAIRAEVPVGEQAWPSGRE